MKNILIIDDDSEYLDIIQSILSKARYETEEARCPDEAFERLRETKYDLIICDLHMPFTLGPEMFNYPYSYEVGTRTISELTEACPGVPIIAVSATMPWDLPGVMKEIPRIPALSKPFAPEDLLAMVEHLTGYSPSPMVH